jgi:hypothetical protein
VTDWIDVHDAYVAEHGDEARPEAVAAADRTLPQEFKPGAVWLVEDPRDVVVLPSNYVQIFGGVTALPGKRARPRTGASTSPPLLGHERMP